MNEENPPLSPPPVDSRAGWEEQGRQRIPAKVFRVAVLLGIGAMFWQAYWHYSTPRLGRLFYPAHTATIVIDQLMDYAEIAETRSGIERLLELAYDISPERATDDCLDICDGVIVHLREQGYSSEPQTAIQSLRAVLLAEAGRTNELLQVVTELDRTASSREITRLLRIAYLSDDLADGSHNSFSGDQLFASKWARDQMRLRLAARLGRSDDTRAVSWEMRRRAGEARSRGRMMFMLQLAGIIGGLCYCACSIRRSGLGLRSPPCARLAPWHSTDGIAAFFFVEALAFVIGVALSRIPTAEAQLLATWCYLLVPAILTAIVVDLVLIRPNGLRFGTHFGLITSGKAIPTVAEAPSRCSV